MNFEEILLNKRVDSISRRACARFNRTLDPDELESCRLIGIWNASKRFNGRSQFTTYVYQHIIWECIKRMKLNRPSGIPLFDIYSKPNRNSFFDLIPEPYQKLLELRFIYNYTFKELGNLTGFSREHARKKVKKALQFLMDMSNNGV